MNNPWLKLPTSAPFVYSLDDVDKLYSTTDKTKALHLECLPEPFLGRVDAPVVLLGLKPGFDPGDPAAHAQPKFAEAARKSLGHQPLEYPLYLLDPAFSSTPGGVYYREALKELAGALGAGRGDRADHHAWKVISNHVLVINFFPYHSEAADLDPKTDLTSQRYGFHLAKQALARDAIVVVVLGKGWWKKSVPGLLKGPRHFAAKNTRTWTFSRGNVPDGFDPVVNRLSGEM